MLICYCTRFLKLSFDPNILKYLKFKCHLNIKKKEFQFKRKKNKLVADMRPIGICNYVYHNLHHQQKYISFLTNQIHVVYMTV